MKIAFVGNCQIAALQHAYARFVAPHDGAELSWIGSALPLTAESRRIVEEADVVIEQRFDLPQPCDLSDLAIRGRRHVAPVVSMSFLWPFAGEQHPRNDGSADNTGGPFNPEMGDRYLNRLLAQGVPPAEAARRYLDLDMAQAAKLDRVREIGMDRQRARDRDTGYACAELIERHWRTEQLFLTPFHPGVRVARYMFLTLLDAIAAPSVCIENADALMTTSFYYTYALPVHPATAEHFGLRWAEPEALYRFHNEGDITFAEYVARYLACRFEPRVHRAIIAVRDRTDGAHDLALEAAAVSPRSPEAWLYLAVSHHRRNETVEAEEAVRRALALRPHQEHAYKVLSDCRYSVADFAGAEAAMSAEIARRPFLDELIAFTACLQFDLGRTAEAISSMNRAISLNPTVAWRRERVKKWGGQPDQAAIEAKPKPSEFRPPGCSKELIDMGIFTKLFPRREKGGQAGAAAKRFAAPALEPSRDQPPLKPEAPEPVQEAPPAASDDRDEERALLELGLAATRRQDWAAAAGHWAEMMQRFPGHVFGYLGTASCLREHGRPDEADAVLAQAVERFPNDAGPLMERAFLANRRRDWALAIPLWEEARARFPDRCAWGGPVALREAGRGDEAEALAAELMARHPGDRAPFMVHAELAESRRDWPEAARRWARMRQAFPQETFVAGRQAAALKAMGSRDAAEAVLLEAMAEAPDDPALLTAHAELAHRDEDWTEAASRWAAVAKASPEVGALYGAIALRSAGRMDDADALLADAVARFPGNGGLASERAWIATRRQDWEEASRRWRTVREQFPDAREGWACGAGAARMLNLRDEADAIASQGLARRPDAWLFEEHAAIAERFQDWPEAALRWARHRAFAPDDVKGYVRGARALREAGRPDEAAAVLDEAVQRFPGDPQPLVQRAWIAHLEGDFPDEAERWAAVRAAFPELREAYAPSIGALRALDRLDDAEAVSAEAVRRFPDDVRLTGEHANVLSARHRWDDAARVFADMRERFPREETGYVGGAAIMRTLCRFAEAEAILVLGMERLPGSTWIRRDHADLPSAPAVWAGRDVPETLRRFGALLRDFPDFEAGYLSAAGHLEAAGQGHDAARVLREGRSRLPDSLSLACRAALARAPDDAEDARVRSAEDLAARFPTSAEAWVARAQILAGEGRAEEAEEAASDALARFPQSSAAAVAYARLAAGRGDHAEAVRRWQAASERFPSAASIRTSLYEAELRLMETERAPGAGARRAAQEADSGDPAQLAARFVSLGGHIFGCEFGIFQRSCGIEPLDMMRWVGIRPGDLARALEDDFDGVGEPEHTQLELSAENEYVSSDARYGMHMHSFVTGAEVPHDRMHKQICARLRFLRGKLLEELAEADKIFVYRTVPADADDAALARIAAALRRHGDNWLLYPRMADEAHPLGHVEVAGPGLMVGRIDRFALTAEGAQLGANGEGWMKVCQGAYAAWRAHRAAYA